MGTGGLRPGGLSRSGRRPLRAPDARDPRAGRAASNGGSAPTCGTRVPPSLSSPLPRSPVPGGERCPVARGLCFVTLSPALRGLFPIRELREKYPAEIREAMTAVNPEWNYPIFVRFPVRRAGEAGRVRAPSADGPCDLARPYCGSAADSLDCKRASNSGSTARSPIRIPAREARRGSLAPFRRNSTGVHKARDEAEPMAAHVDRPTSRSCKESRRTPVSTRQRSPPAQEATRGRIGLPLLRGLGLWRCQFPNPPWPSACYLRDHLESEHRNGVAGFRTDCRRRGWTRP